MHLESRERFLDYNRKVNKELYHDSGLFVSSQTPFQNGTFAGDSFKTLSSMQFPLQKLNSAEEIRNRFPKWNQNGDLFVEGYFNPWAGI